MMKLIGEVWKLGVDVNTDYILPGRYMELTDPDEMATHTFEEHYPEFLKGVKSGDIIVGATNFGCGSSREHAPLALKYSGISCVLAESFARIFYRNCINIGLLALECPSIHGDVNKNDKIEVNVALGLIKNLTTGTLINFNPLPEFMMDVLNAGGLSQYLSEAEDW
jgi:3-isopropylmalate/(R)-2-methylmalate dehydratase small subunit